MDVLLVTNERCATYHGDLLAASARQAGVRLRQLVPPGSSPDAELELTTRLAEVAEADLVVVNGIHSPHTRRALHYAARAQRPVCLSELAYLRPLPPPPGVVWQAATCISAATQAIIAHCTGLDHRAPKITGWPGADRLSCLEPIPGRVLALTGVSAASSALDHSDDANEQLRAVLSAFTASWPGEIVLRPHPREQPRLWREWPLDQHADLSAAVAQAQLIIGVAGTAAFACAALGRPFLAVGAECLPPSLQPLVVPIASAQQALTLAPTAVARDPRSLDPLIGPIGHAGERIVAAWQKAVRDFDRSHRGVQQTA